jgi:hypothetical protein
LEVDLSDFEHVDLHGQLAYVRCIELDSFPTAGEAAAHLVFSTIGHAWIVAKYVLVHTGLQLSILSRQIEVAHLQLLVRGF